MQKIKSFGLYCVALMLCILQVQAEVTWDQVKQRALSAKSYKAQYLFEGPRGDFKFDYVYMNSGNNIRTEILRSNSDPSKRGSIVIYDKSWAADKVRAKVGGGAIVRNLTHKDVEDTPFHQSLFKLIIDDVDNCGAPSTSSKGSLTVFKFNCGQGPYTIWANQNGDIVQTEARVVGGVEKRRITGHSWNGSYSTKL